MDESFIVLDDKRGTVKFRFDDQQRQSERAHPILETLQTVSPFLPISETPLILTFSIHIILKQVGPGPSDEASRSLSSSWALHPSCVQLLDMPPTCQLTCSKPHGVLQRQVPSSRAGQRPLGQVSSPCAPYRHSQGTTHLREQLPVGWTRSCRH